MSPHRSLALARHELRLLRRDPFPLVILVLMPLALMPFMKSSLRLALVQEGYPGANGAEQVVPGMTVTFSFFLVGMVAMSFFDEHGWHTWDRLRVSAARPLEVLVGKTLPRLAVAYLQFAVVMTVGVTVFGLDIRGSVPALGLLLLGLALCLGAMGLLLTAVCRTVQQANALSNVGSMVLAGIGGALVPFALIPAWARAVAPATPSYWAMRGSRSVILDGGSFPEVLLPTAALLAFATAFVLLALWRFRFDETKQGWS
ncbi:MAG: ABC transporter permease [Acidimicrobiia bacterium]|nr:ABC transporter permease [Acidimicrobiia bacterium]